MSRHPLTPFGMFVTELRQHFLAKDYKISMNRLVSAITGSNSRPQNSRYLHHYNTLSQREQVRPEEIYFYHKKTIAKMITSVFTTEDLPEGMVKGVSTGYTFRGKPGDVETVYAVRQASILRACCPDDPLCIGLNNVALDASCTFCKSMYHEYDKVYTQCSGVISSYDGSSVSDLERYIRSIKDSDKRRIKEVMIKSKFSVINDTLCQSLEIYSRILSAILLGPDSMHAVSEGLSTPSSGGKKLQKQLDGFSLAQKMICPSQKIILSNEKEFDRYAEVGIGRESGEDIGYVTLHDSPLGVPNCVSKIHAIIRPNERQGEISGWNIEHCSCTNETVVCHSGGETIALTRPGQATYLKSHDEIWLAPHSCSSGVRWVRSYERGAVLLFDYMYKYVLPST